MSKEIRGSFWLIFIILTFVSCDVMEVEDEDLSEGKYLSVTEPVFDVVELNQFGLDEATDINDQGDIIGGSYFLDYSTKEVLDIGFTGKSLNDNGQITGELKGIAYFWENGTGEKITHPYHDFDVVDEWIAPYDINNNGQVVGEAWIVDLVQQEESEDFIYIDTEEAFQWNNGDSEYSAIEHYGRANGINDHGLIVGTHPMGAFKWSPGSYMSFLTDTEGNFEEAHAVNNKRQIVGSVMTSDQGNLLAGPISEESSNIMSDIMKVQGITESRGIYDASHLLRMLKTSDVPAKGIDKIYSGTFDFREMYNEKMLSVWDKDKQQEIINSVLKSSYKSKAYIWDENNGDQEIGTLNGGDWSTAFDINEHGQVVGYSDIGNGEYRAFYWDKENGMIELPSGDKNSIARAINNHGQIVGENDGPVMWEVTLPNSTLP